MKSNQHIKRGEKCPTCGRYFSRNVVVDSLILKDGKILLIKRGIDPQKGFWALSGGYLDWNETAAEGAAREAHEETGSTVRVTRFFNVYSRPDRDNNIQNVALVYVLELTDENFHRQEEEIEAIEWFQLDALPENIAFDHRKIIEDYKQSITA